MSESLKTLKLSGHTSSLFVRTGTAFLPTPSMRWRSRSGGCLVELGCRVTERVSSSSWGSILEVMDAEMKRDGKVDYKKGLKQCRKLQGVLQDMDREATETLARKPLKLIHLNGCTDLRGCIQDPILPLYAPCPFIVCDHLGWIILLCLASPRHLVSCLYHNSSHPPLSLCPF